jgi:hypothetical protein
LGTDTRYRTPTSYFYPIELGHWFSLLISSFKVFFKVVFKVKVKCYVKFEVKVPA